MSPGRNDFRFGADVYLDASSELLEADNGDNILQRGLYADDAQYKLQVDHGIPSCRMRGTDGSIFVQGAVIRRMTWVRVECARRGAKVSLHVTAIGHTATQTWFGAGPTGDISYTGQTLLSMGGKVDAERMVVVHDSDQFNGALDNVFFEVG